MKRKIFVLLLASFSLTACSLTAPNTEFQTAKAEQHPIHISAIYFIKGGYAPLSINWSNTGSKRINKVVFDTGIYDMDNKKLMTKEFEAILGPYPPISQIRKGSSTNRAIWPGTWYRQKMDCLMIEKIEIHYQHESTLTIDSKEDLKRYIEKESYTDCTVPLGSEPESDV